MAKIGSLNKEVIVDLSKIKGSIWFDGEIIDWQDAKVHLLTHTLHYGLGVFEGVRAYNTPKGPSIFRLQDHTERLFSSAETVNMRIPFSQIDLNEAHKEVIKLNQLTEAFRFNDAVIRNLVIKRNKAVTKPSPLFKSDDEDARGRNEEFVKESS